MIRIGIDVGKSTGIAAVDLDGPTALELYTVSFEQAAPLALGLALIYGASIVIEEPQAAHVYQRPGQGAGAMRKIALNVGQCREKALSLADSIERTFRRWGIPGLSVTLRPPVRGGTKWDRGRMEVIFGWMGPSSSHSRDAAVIAMMGE